MYLIVGLGNPGAEYEWSRHNLVFMLIDKLAKRCPGERQTTRMPIAGWQWVDRRQARFALVKPQTYMNFERRGRGCLLKKGEVPKRINRY